MPEPDNVVLHLLREMREELRELRVETVTKSELAELRSEVNSLRADVASDFLALEKRLSEQIVGLRRAVVEYHSSVVGHGVLISDLDERVRRLEATAAPR